MVGWRFASSVDCSSVDCLYKIVDVVDWWRQINLFVCVCVNSMFNSQRSFSNIRYVFECLPLISIWVVFSRGIYLTLTLTDALYVDHLNLNFSLRLCLTLTGPQRACVVAVVFAFVFVLCCLFLLSWVVVASVVVFFVFVCWVLCLFLFSLQVLANLQCHQRVWTVHKVTPHIPTLIV